MSQAMDWKETGRRARRMSASALEYAASDCWGAAVALGPGEYVGKDASYYMDELSVYRAELKRRGCR